jgi:hypothetical protein
MSKPFAVGDKVKLIVDYPDNNQSLIKGDTGKIVGVKSVPLYNIQWDKKVAQGHDCDRLCLPGYGWNVYGTNIELVKEEVEEVVTGRRIKIKNKGENVK